MDKPAITSATFQRMLKALRENSNVKEKREALIYISSQAKKLEASGAIKEERYKDLCRLVVEAFSKHDGIFQIEALGAFNAIIREFRMHPLHLFESMLQTDMKTRLKIFKLLEVLDDNAISAAANDGQALNFFKSCLINVQPTLMEWLMPTACVDNLQLLTKIEQQPLSEEQKLEEDINSYALALLKRLYRLASITFDQSVQKFDTLLMDKIVTLAYMGHKRQRGPALKLLQQAIATNSSSHIRKDYPDVWAQYKTNLQSSYYKRMLLLVAACDLDWTTQWNTTIQFLSTDLHRGASLINNLLSVEEKAFKSTDPIIRRQAFLSWRLLIDNFALDNQELATARRIKLLCIPLNAKNSKTELIALTKLEVWWHLIIKLYRDIGKFVNPVITQFLNYCFGPLGDTPLLSSKFDVVASPGKRFFKTKVVAVDALSQLLVAKEDLVAVCSPMLEERLPHAISYEVFGECSKNIIHSIAEALLILGQLTDKEMKNRFQLGKTLWTSLMIYIRNVKLETKDHLYRDVILVVTELGNYIDKVMVRDMIFSVILPDINCIIEKTEFQDNSLPELVLKLLTSPTLDELLKYILDYDSNAIKCLLERCVSPEFTYSSGVLGFLETIMEHLKSVYNARQNKDSNKLVYIELWSIIAEILTKYIRNTEIRGDDSFKVMKSVLSFPFLICLKDLEQIKNQTIVWKTVYKEIELHSDLVTTMKPNEILLDTANMMRNCLSINKNCCTFIVNCLDALLSTLEYESLLAQDEIPSIMQLIIDVITISFNDVQNLNSEIALKALSAMLITVFGHSTQKVVSYLHNCKSVIELILSSQTTALFKEVASTWEYIVSIFKGLNKQLDHELLSSYKKAIVIATNHANPDIKSLTQSIFEIKDSLDSTAKCILDEIEKPKEESHPKSNTVSKKKAEIRQTKDVRIAGSFLNRKSTTPKSVSHKSPEKNEKNPPTLPEPDSQDYVYIKTDLKFDVNRLTEHQKETLKRKREDIPALYNDLSQSSSQNSQNLQQWFDIKAKHINENDKVSNKKSDPTMQKPIDNDANKENKVITKQVEISNAADKIVDNVCSNELDVNTEENTVEENTKQKENSTKRVKNDDSNEKQNTSKQTNLSSHVASISEKNITSKADEEADAAMTIESVAKKLDFESLDEFPEEKMHERQSSPSMLDNIKRRHRSSMAKLSVKDDETVETQKDPSATNVQRALRVKTTQGKPGTNSKQKSDDDTDIKENVNENKKGVKRKSVSDNESDVSVQRRKRKLITSTKNPDDGGETSRISENVFSDIDMDNVSQRVKNEISRLKIDMVFDCPAINRRRERPKHLDDGEKETIVHGLRKYGTLDKSFKFKADAKSAEGSKRSPKAQEKSTKDADDTDQGVLKKRGRRSKQEFNKNDLDINKDINKDVNKNMNKDVEDVNKDKDVKKFNDTIDKVSELKNADTGMTHVVPTSSQTVQDVDKAQDERFEDNLKSNSDVRPAELIILASEQSQDEIEDVVESSQASNIDLTMGKICGDKQCFIKINKMNAVYTPKAPDAIVDKNYVPETIPMDYDDNDVPDPCAELDVANLDSNTETKDEKNTDSVDKDSVQKTDNSSTKSLILEGQKTIDNSSSTKSTSVISFSSSRGNSKIFSKPKPFTGRAAHMLGLVTNQTLLEGDNQAPIVLEEESSMKKLKTKDADNEVSTNKKTSVIKEIDKIGGPSGSRQEKIFSNMRSTDYSASSSTHTFTSLKNDGEKLSFRLNKGASDCLPTESLIDQETERIASPSRERDDLPILEWSSANPPSLTASPSASILKRHRSSLPEVDLDISTPKRKRVSFADPPVSKEMGYEISIVESPQKVIKYSMTRIPTSRKDSPIKFKQMKLKLVPYEEKVVTEDNTQDENVTEVVEKSNESLTKIPETCIEAANINEQISGDSLENSNNTIEINSGAKIEIMTRIPMSRKDSPIKLKQMKLKLVPYEEKVVTEANIQVENVTEVVEKNNESLTKTPETCTEAADINEQISGDFLENSNNTIEINSCAKIDIIDELGLAQEIEITTDSFVREQDIEDSDDSSPIDVGTEDSETQQDIFEGTDAKTNVILTSNDDTNTIVHNDSVDSIKLNVTDDSVIAALPKDDNSTSMEDTVDAQNITELNSTENEDETFYEKPIRSSTYATENLAEQDTLSATDSIFSSLASTQDIQHQEFRNNAELDPEFLDTTQSIYPTLSSCMESIDSIIERLTYPLWKQNLTRYFANRNMHTIGDFAQLSEREINRLPVKGKPKTEFVKKVLEQFENMCLLQTEPSDKKANKVEQLYNETADEAPTVPISAAFDVEAGSVKIDNETVTCSIPFTRFPENTSDGMSKTNLPTKDLDKTESVTSDLDISLEEPITSNLLILDVSKDEQISTKIPIAVQISKPGTSADNDEPVPIPSSSSEIIVTTSQVALSSSTSLDVSKEPVGSSSAYDELLITHSSIGTNTDEVISTTPTVQTKSVASQMTLAELLDEIDLNQVMESAVRRCSPEAILLQYKVKMAHLKEGELLKETIRMLGLQNKQQVNDASLKAACRACGVNKVLLRLPDIFSYDKQFFDKVLKVYSKKLNIADGLKNLDFNQLKNAICQKCTSSQIVEILSEKLKQEEQEGIKQSMPELSSLNAMLKRLPMDVIISHTVANEELIPAPVVLDIALQNNSSGDIAQALTQSPVMARRILDKLWTSQFTVASIKNNDVSKESLLNIFKSVCSKLTGQELLDAYHEAMASKLTNVKNAEDFKEEKK